MEAPNTPSRRESRRSGRPFGGVVLIVVGSLLLAREMGLLVPHWIFSWPMIPIAVGLYIGARHSFATGGWLIPIVVGVFFLVNNEFLNSDLRQYFWPVFIITMGLLMVLRPRFHSRKRSSCSCIRVCVSSAPNGSSIKITGGS